MRRRRVAYRRLLRGAALFFSLFVACESPFEPKGDGERIPLNLVIEQDVDDTSPRFYSFSASPNALYAVYFQSLEGNILFHVIDSVSGGHVASVSATPTSTAGRLEDNALASFGSPTARVYRIIVQTFFAGATARFRFKIEGINTNPERTLRQFEIGDTVAGETIDPKLDLDRFVVRGTAGQEVVVVGETLAPVGSGSVSFSLIDPAGPQFLGYVLADAGPPTLTTGRMVLPATREYELSVVSVISNIYPRYRGPYRFWSYAVNRGPEHRAAAIPTNTEITTEAIERAGDLDEFTFQANSGTAFMAFLQSAHQVQAEMAAPGGPALALATCDVSDTSLFARVSNRLEPTAPGPFVLRVSGTNQTQIADTGKYRLFLYEIDRKPEHVPAVMPAGSAVLGEDIGLPGDVDEFTFNGTAGEEVDAFFQAQNGSPDQRLQLDFVDPTGSVVTAIQSTGTDTSLFQQVTGRLPLQTTGTYRLRVTGYDAYCGRGYRGGYQIFLHRVNSHPEHVPDTLAFGDSVSGEAIDLPGDFDEFRVTVPDSSGANLVAELQTPGSLIVKLIDSTTGTVIATSTGTTGRMILAPGRYIVRVDASVPYDRSSVRGPYRLWFYRFELGPESVSDTIAIGDTVTGERIQPTGDLDRFWFYGQRGQHINIALQGLSGMSGAGYQAWIQGPPGAPVWVMASVSSGTSDPTLRDHQTGRLDLPITGWYYVDMTGLGAEGSYKLLVEPLGTAPETAPANLSLGDSVSESVDVPADWDDFTISASPGQDAYLLFFGGTSSSVPFIRVSDGAAGDSLAGNVGHGTRMVGPFRMPASGQVTVSVFENVPFVRFCYDATCASAFRLTGPYAFRVQALNRAPETAAAGFVVGDTVRGEQIAPIGDFDEFTTTATPGEMLTLSARLVADPVPAGIIRLEVVDAVTGTILQSGSGLIGGGATSPFYALAVFNAPPSGSVMIRWGITGILGTDLTTAPYEFVLNR